MDSRQQRQFFREMARLTSDPEKASIARKVFCSEDSKVQDENASGEEASRARLLHFIGIFLAFLSWWYTLVNPEPNFWIGSAILLGAALFLLLAVWESASWKYRGKIVSGVIVALLFFGMEYGWHWQRLAVVRAAELKSQTDKREEVRKLLAAHMEYDLGDTPVRSVFVYENNAESGIIVDQISAIVKTILFGDGGALHESHLVVNSDKKPIGANGDGQSDPFLERFFGQTGGIKFRGVKGKLLPLACADVVMEIDYHLEYQPTIKQIKQFRFATRPTKNGVKWLKVSVLPWTDDYCTNSLFQNKAKN